jgi:hypothetical protein
MHAATVSPLKQQNDLQDVPDSTLDAAPTGDAVDWDALADEENVDTRTAARFLKMSHKTLQNWRHINAGPRFLKYGRGMGRAGLVRYRMGDLRAFLLTLENTPPDLILPTKSHTYIRPPKGNA